jgi:hypothetical protein
MRSERFTIYDPHNHQQRYNEPIVLARRWCWWSYEEGVHLHDEANELAHHEA